MPENLANTATLEQQAVPSQPGDATLLDDGDRPVVPADTGSDDQPAAKDAQTPAADKAAPADPDTAAKPTAAKPDAPPQGYVRETDLRTLQANYDRRLSETMTRAEQLATRLAQFESEGAVRARTDATREVLREWLTAQGVDPAPQAQRLEQIAQAFGQAEQNARKVAELEQQMGALTQTNLNTIMVSWVSELAREHKLEADDIRTLKSLYRPDALANGEALMTTGKELEERAKQLGSIRAAAAAAKRAKQEEAPPQKFDNAQGAGGMSDRQLWEAYGKGTFHDHEKATAAGQRLGLI